MGRRRARTKPTATELARVERVLVAEPAFARHLGPKLRMEKRTGEGMSFHVGTIAVAEAMMAAKLKPERERVRVVLRVAIEVFGIRGREAVWPYERQWSTRSPQERIPMAQGNSITFAARNQVNGAVLDPEDRLLPPLTSKSHDVIAVIVYNAQSRLLVCQV